MHNQLYIRSVSELIMFTTVSLSLSLSRLSLILSLFLSLSLSLYIYKFSDVKFSLVLQYTPNNTYNCSPLSVPNEGVLIKALIDNTTIVPLHFCYVNGTEDNYKMKHIPTMSFTKTSLLNLTYNTTAYNANTYAKYITYTVPFTASSAVGPYLYNITINNDLLLNQTVRFAWNQTYRAPHANCDVWALDNISISLQHNGCYRQIYQQDFNNGEIPGWDLINSTISFNSSQCDSSSGCLYFTGGPDYIGVASRQATSPILDLNFVTPATLPSSPTTYKENICNTDENIM